MEAGTKVTKESTPDGREKIEFKAKLYAWVNGQYTMFLGRWVREGCEKWEKLGLPHCICWPMSSSLSPLDEKFPFSVEENIILICYLQFRRGLMRLPIHFRKKVDASEK